MNTIQPVTEARRWCLRKYRIARERGATPLQGMLEVYQDAAGQVAHRSTPTSEWRKAVARRYFGTIAQKAKGDTLTAEFWKVGRCLATY
jgi:hypothetical protein